MNQKTCFALGLAGLLLLLGPVSFGQRVLLQNTVADDTARTTYGPNRAYFSHFYLSYMAVAGKAAPESPLRYGRSNDLALGFRHKFRLTQTLALGADARYDYLVYHLAQQTGKTVPTTTLYERELLALHQLQLAPFVRLNLGRRRGNAIGRYLDLTGWGGWALGSRHVYDEAATATARKTTVTERGLPYMNRWTYGVGARVGAGRWALVGRYRLSDTFAGSEKSRWPELPRGLVGLEIGWF